MKVVQELNYAQFIERHGASLGLTAVGIQYVLSVVNSPPSREPQNATGRNQIVDFASLKMGQTMGLESMNPEAAYAEFNDNDSECLGQWAQPASIRPTVTCKGGIKRPDWITLDFLVLKNEGLFLVECKRWDDAKTISRKRPEYFVLDEESGRWTIPEVEEELKKYGIKSIVITERDLPTKLIRNLSVLDGVRGLGYSDPHSLSRIIEILRSEKQGLSLATLLAATGAGFAKNDLFIAILSNDEAEQITVFAKAGANRLSPGSYLGVAQQGGNPSEIEVHFAPSGKKPHEFAWEQFAKLVGGVAAGSPEAVKHQVSMMRFLGRKGAMPWQKPNEVRNLWNYSDARLFCEHGETEGNKMAEFILAPKEAVKWGIGKQIHACDRDHATGLSYIRASLSGAIERVAQTILPERLAGQIAA